MAVSAAAASVIIRNSTIAARFPGGLASFAASCPNQTFCTDGTVTRVGFMATIDAQTFVRQLVAAGLAPSLEEAHSDIALVIQGRGFAHPCDWLQLGLFDGRPSAWLANADRGALCIPKWELNSGIADLNSKEFEFAGLTGNGKLEVYRHRKTGEIRYVGRPYRPVVRKWWQIWKRPELLVDAQNYGQVFETASALIRPYIEYQLGEPPVSPTGQRQLRQALEMFYRILQFNPGDLKACGPWGSQISVSGSSALLTRHFKARMR